MVYVCVGSSLSVTVSFIRTHLFDWNCNLLQPFITHTWPNVHTRMYIHSYIHMYYICILIHGCDSLKSRADESYHLPYVLVVGHANLFYYVY